MKPAKFAKRYLCIGMPAGPRSANIPHNGACGPIIEDSVTESPVTEGPVTESPVTESPVTESPVTESRIADRAALDELAIWCQQFSPVVAIVESTAAEFPKHDALLLEVTGLAHLFDGEEALAMLVVQRFHQRGIHVQVAVADTIGAAWALAHFGWPISDCRLPIDASDPHHQFAICNLKSEILLAPLPLAALRLPETTIELLDGLGIRTIAQLAALPREQLSARFGPELLLRLDQATGKCDEALHAVHATSPASAEWLLESPTYRLDTLRQVLKTLITKVTDRLSASGHGVLALVCRLELQAGRPLEIPIGLYRPSLRPHHLVDLATLQLERLRLAEPVCSVQVVATVTTLLETRQQELFEGTAATHRTQGTQRLIDRLSSRLGRTAVCSSRLLRDAIPERAYRLRPLTGQKQKAATRGRRPPQARPSTSAILRRRPLWLRPSPSRLHVMATSDGRPLRFRWGTYQYEVAEAVGPERIETGWWRRESPRQVRRDYYRVETTTGQRFWLFRRHRDNQWFLHGEFD